MIGSESELVTKNWPFTSTGAVETGVQTADGPRFVAETKEKVGTFVGQEKTRLPP